MTYAEHTELVDFLESTMRPKDCDGTLSRTIAWLNTHHLDVGECLAALAARGAGCDCEVVLNDQTHPMNMMGNA
jgi:Protein of unknown function (DUF2695)